MGLTAEQREIQRLLVDAWARAGDGARIVYESEWLGWLPFGQYHWVNVEHADGKDEVSRHFPSGWEREDVFAIEAAGSLRRLSETHESNDVRIVYEMTEEG